MIYKLVNSKRIIGSMFENRNIDYSGFISRVPNWIFSAMGKLNIKLAYIPAIVEVAVADYKALIPDECKKLRGVSYKGYRLPRIDRLNEDVTDDMPDLVHEEYKYEINPNGYIVLPFEECDLGDLKFYIKKFPLEKDELTQLYFPLIPEDEQLYTALEWYILLMLLQRGHKVGNLSLEKQNEFLNPGIAWEKYKQKAKNSVNRLDIDEREKISKMMRTFIMDYNYYTQESFNYKSKV